MIGNDDTRKDDTTPPPETAPSRSDAAVTAEGAARLAKLLGVEETNAEDLPDRKVPDETVEAEWEPAADPEPVANDTVSATDSPSTSREPLNDTTAQRPAGTEERPTPAPGEASPGPGANARTQAPASSSASPHVRVPMPPAGSALGPEPGAGDAPGQTGTGGEETAPPSAKASEARPPEAADTEPAPPPPPASDAAEAEPGRSEPPKPPAPESSAVIEARRLSLTFATRDGPVEALSNIDLKIDRGEFVSLIGPSGCGKTTLLRVIADLERPTAGQVTVNGVAPEEARKARGYGYVFQAPALYPWRNIARNVALPLEVMGLGTVERERRIASNLELVNLNGFERKYPWQLSGGMQQRVSIARALAVEADLLLMDEPFGALDEIVRDHLNEQLHELWRTTRKTVVFVTHSIPEAVYLSSRIVVMTPRPGQIHDVIESPLPRQRGLDIRDTPEFLKVAHRVREGLKAGRAYED